MTCFFATICYIEILNVVMLQSCNVVNPCLD